MEEPNQINESKTVPLSTLSLVGAALVCFLSLGLYLVLRFRSTYSPPPTTISTASISPTPKISLPSLVDNTSLFFFRDDKVYKLSPLSASPEVFLDKADSVAFFPDKTKIAFIKGYGENEDNNVYTKDLTTGEIKLIIPAGDWAVNRGLDISPNGKHILVDAGTGPEGSLTVYDSTTGRQLSLFGDGYYVWQGAETIYMSSRTHVSPPRPWGAGSGSSIVKINVTTGNTQTILRADSNNDYSLSQIKNNCLFFTKTHVEDSKDWESKPVSTNYCYNLDTKKVTTATEEETKTETEILRQQAQGLVGKSRILQIIKSSNLTSWVVMTIYHGDSIYNSDIAIVDLGSPATSFQVLAKGANPIWHSSLDATTYSPDRSRICFTVWDPIVPVLYLSNSDSSDKVRVGIGKSCTWSPDGSKVAYTSHVTDISPIDVYIYDIASSISKNLTSDLTSPPLIRYYSDPVWVDNQSLRAPYIEANLSTGSESTGSTDLISGQ